LGQENGWRYCRQLFHPSQNKVSVTDNVKDRF
jgi:hypothetical protein